MHGLHRDQRAPEAGKHPKKTNIKSPIRNQTTATTGIPLRNPGRAGRKAGSPPPPPRTHADQRAGGMRAAYIPLEAAKNGESTAKRGLWGSRENSSSPGREPPASGPLAPAAAAGRQARAVVRRLPATLSMAAAAAFLSGGWIGWVERRSGRGEAAWWRHGVDENCRRRERKKKQEGKGSTEGCWPRPSTRWALGYLLTSA